MFLLNMHVLNLRDKKGKTVLNAFIKIVNEYNRKPNNYGFITEEISH